MSYFTLVLNDRLHTFSAYEQYEHRADRPLRYFGVQRFVPPMTMPRASGAATGPDASRRAISSWRKLRNTLSTRLPLDYQYAGPRTACEGGINRRDTVLINQIVGFIGFQARVAAIFRKESVLPSARARTAQREMQRFAGAARFQKPPDAIWRPPRSVQVSSSHTKNSAAIFVFTMPNDGAGTHPRSVFIRVTPNAY